MISFRLSQDVPGRHPTVVNTLQRTANLCSSSPLNLLLTTEQEESFHTVDHNLFPMPGTAHSVFSFLAYCQWFQTVLCQQLSLKWCWASGFWRKSGVSGLLGLDKITLQRRSLSLNGSPHFGKNSTLLLVKLFPPIQKKIDHSIVSEFGHLGNICNSNFQLITS